MTQILDPLQRLLIPMVDQTELGRRLRARREALDINQASIGALIDMSGANYSKVEAGLIPIAAMKLAVVARELRVSLDSLFDEHAGMQRLIDTDVDRELNNLHPLAKRVALDAGRAVQREMEL